MLWRGEGEAKRGEAAEGEGEGREVGRGVRGQSETLCG